MRTPILLSVPLPGDPSKPPKKPAADKPAPAMTPPAQKAAAPKSPPPAPPAPKAATPAPAPTTPPKQEAPKAAAPTPPPAKPTVSPKPMSPPPAPVSPPPPPAPTQKPTAKPPAANPAPAPKSAPAPKPASTPTPGRVTAPSPGFKPAAPQSPTPPAGAASVEDLAAMDNEKFTEVEAAARRAGDTETLNRVLAAKRIKMKGGAKPPSDAGRQSPPAESQTPAEVAPAAAELEELAGIWDLEDDDFRSRLGAFDPETLGRVLIGQDPAVIDRVRNNLPGRGQDFFDTGLGIRERSVPISGGGDGGTPSELPDPGAKTGIAGMDDDRLKTYTDDLSDRLAAAKVGTPERDSLVGEYGDARREQIQREFVASQQGQTTAAKPKKPTGPEVRPAPPARLAGQTGPTSAFKDNPRPVGYQDDRYTAQYDRSKTDFRLGTPDQDLDGLGQLIEEEYKGLTEGGPRGEEEWKRQANDLKARLDAFEDAGGVVPPRRRRIIDALLGAGRKASQMPADPFDPAPVQPDRPQPVPADGDTDRRVRYIEPEEFGRLSDAELKGYRQTLLRRLKDKATTPAEREELLRRFSEAGDAVTDRERPVDQAATAKEQFVEPDEFGSFDDAALDKYKAVLFRRLTGRTPMTDAQKADIRRRYDEVVAEQGRRDGQQPQDAPPPAGQFQSEGERVRAERAIDGVANRLQAASKPADRLALAQQLAADFDRFAAMNGGRPHPYQAWFDATERANLPKPPSDAKKGRMDRGRAEPLPVPTVFPAMPYPDDGGVAKAMDKAVRSDPAQYLPAVEKLIGREMDTLGRTVAGPDRDARARKIANAMAVYANNNKGTPHPRQDEFEKASGLKVAVPPPTSPKAPAEPTLDDMLPGFEQPPVAMPVPSAPRIKKPGSAPTAKTAPSPPVAGGPVPADAVVRLAGKPEAEQNLNLILARRGAVPPGVSAAMLSDLAKAVRGGASEVTRQIGGRTYRLYYDRDPKTGRPRLKFKEATATPAAEGPPPLDAAKADIPTGGGGTTLGPRIRMTRPGAATRPAPRPAPRPATTAVPTQAPAAQTSQGLLAPPQKIPTVAEHQAEMAARKAKKAGKATVRGPIPGGPAKGPSAGRVVDTEVSRNAGRISDRLGQLGLPPEARASTMTQIADVIKNVMASADPNSQMVGRAYPEVGPPENPIKVVLSLHPAANGRQKYVLSLRPGQGPSSGGGSSPSQTAPPSSPTGPTRGRVVPPTGADPADATGNFPTGPDSAFDASAFDDPPTKLELPSVGATRMDKTSQDAYGTLADFHSQFGIPKSAIPDEESFSRLASSAPSMAMSPQDLVRLANTAATNQMIGRGLSDPGVIAGSGMADQENDSWDSVLYHASNPGGEKPVVVRYGGKDTLLDGDHRIVASVLQGKPIDVRVIDLDSKNNRPAIRLRPPGQSLPVPTRGAGGTPSVEPEDATPVEDDSSLYDADFTVKPAGAIGPDDRTPLEIQLPAAQAPKLGGRPLALPPPSPKSRSASRFRLAPGALTPPRQIGPSGMAKTAESRGGPLAPRTGNAVTTTGGQKPNPITVPPFRVGPPPAPPAAPTPVATATARAAANPEFRPAESPVSGEPGRIYREEYDAAVDRFALDTVSPDLDGAAAAMDELGKAIPPGEPTTREEWDALVKVSALTDAYRQARDLQMKSTPVAPEPSPPPAAPETIPAPASATPPATPPVPTAAPKAASAVDPARRANHMRDLPALLRGGFSREQIARMFKVPPETVDEYTAEYKAAEAVGKKATTAQPPAGPATDTPPAPPKKGKKKATVPAGETSGPVTTKPKKTAKKPAVAPPSTGPATPEPAPAAPPVVPPVVPSPPPAPAQPPTPAQRPTVTDRPAQPVAPAAPPDLAKSLRWFQGAGGYRFPMSTPQGVSKDLWAEFDGLRKGKMRPEFEAGDNASRTALFQKLWDLDGGKFRPLLAPPAARPQPVTTTRPAQPVRPAVRPAVTPPPAQTTPVPPAGGNVIRPLEGAIGTRTPGNTGRVQSTVDGLWYPADQVEEIGPDGKPVGVKKKAKSAPSDNDLKAAADKTATRKAKGLPTDEGTLLSLPYIIRIRKPLRFTVRPTIMQA